MIGVREVLTGLGAILGMFFGFALGWRYGCFGEIGFALALFIPGAFAGMLLDLTLEFVGDFARRFIDRQPWLAWTILGVLMIAFLLGAYLLLALHAFLMRGYWTKTLPSG